MMPQTGNLSSSDIRALPFQSQLALAGALHASPRDPQQVSHLIAHSRACSADEAHALSVSQRQAVLREIALCCGGLPAWCAVTCNACEESADLLVEPDDLRASEAAGSSAPITCEWRDMELRLAPLDGHCEQLAASDGADVLAQIVVHCARQGGGNSPAALALLGDASAEEIEAIALQLVAASEHACVLTAPDCPNCGAPIRFAFDALDWIGRFAHGALREVDLLARRYGWDEEVIGNLPDDRRAAYCRLAREAAT